MSINDLDDGREKTFQWLDRAYPYDVAPGSEHLGKVALMDGIRLYSTTARQLATSPNWSDKRHPQIDFTIAEPGGSWNFEVNIGFVSRIKNRTVRALRQKNPTYDLGPARFETHTTIPIPEHILSLSIKTIDADVRRSFFKILCRRELAHMTRDLDLVEGIHELERMQALVAEAYRHVLQGIVHPGFDPNATHTNENSGTMPPQDDRPQ